MVFFKQLLAGVTQEFQIYSNFPKRLATFLFPIIYPAFMALFIEYSKTAFKKEELPIVLKVLDLLFYSPPLWLSISEMAHRKQTNIDKFININGMSKSAYLAKILLANYLLMLPLVIAKMADVTVFKNQYTSGQIQAYLCYMLAANIAAVNLGLFISCFSTPQQATAIAISLFGIVPGGYLTLAAADNTFIKSLSAIICALNPYLLRLDIVQNETQSEWNKAGLISLALGILYFCLYTLHEKLVEYEKNKKRNQGKGYEDLPVELSLALMNGNTNPLLDIENSDLPGPVVFSEQAPESDKKAILRMTNLTKIFKDSHSPALDNITLNIFEKEIFCLIGHNGAGKTTLLNVLTGLLPRTEGSIYYGNEEVNSEKIRRSIGFCTQDNLALTENSVYENLIFMAKIRNVDKSFINSEVQRVMQKLGILPYQKNIVCNLNQEQRKRLSIAISLLNNPQVIIMDEPTSGLDAVARREFWRIIRELKQDQKTVIFTTQFLDDAEELADRVTILSKGRLFAVGSVDFMKKKFGTGYTLVISNRQYPAYLATQAPQINKIVQNLIPSAEIISDTTLNILKYAISSIEQKKFSRLFRDLEDIPDIQINLQRTSLEEAFESLERDPDFNNFLNQESSKEEESSQVQETFWTKSIYLSKNIND